MVVRRIGSVEQSLVGRVRVLQSATASRTALTLHLKAPEESRVEKLSTQLGQCLFLALCVFDVLSPSRSGSWFAIQHFDFRDPFPSSQLFGCFERSILVTVRQSDLFYQTGTHTQSTPLSSQFVHAAFFFCPSAGSRSSLSCFSLRSHFTLRWRHAPQAENCCRPVLDWLGARWVRIGPVAYAWLVGEVRY